MFVRACTVTGGVSKLDFIPARYVILLSHSPAITTDTQHSPYLCYLIFIKQNPDTDRRASVP
jgi:hypothetical protein